MKTLMIAVSTVFGLMIACSSPPTGRIDVDVEGKDAGRPQPPPPGPGPGSSLDAGGSRGTDTGTGPTAPTADCKPGTQPDDCTQCCEAKFPGSKKLDAAFLACMCTTPGLCKKECGTTYCAKKAPSAACQGCQASEQCFQKTNDGCNADPTCKGFLECAAACNPEGQGGGQDDEPQP